MNEIEVKILEIDVEKVINTLESLGAIKTFEGDMYILYLDTPNHDLQKNQTMLRLRSKGQLCELTVKKVIDISDMKEMDEQNIMVSSFKTYLDFFVSLGYVVIKKTQKHRISYSYEKMSFEIDTIKHIPTFLEIEGQTKESVYEWVEKLGFSQSEMKSWSGSDVIKHYQKR